MNAKGLGMGIIVLASCLGASAYMSATMHHDLSELEDADDNGFPDSLESYMAGATNLPVGYDFSVEDTDLDGLSDLHEWILGIDPLEAMQHQSSTPVAGTNGAMAIQMKLPTYFGSYGEVFGKADLVTSNWEVLDGWIPTYGAGELLWYDVVRSNTASYFFMVFDADMDLDGDGYSDHRETYITLTDPAAFNYVNADGDDMHDWYELKLFGDLSQTGTNDFDGDTLLNNQELVWLPGNVFRMYSDPSLYSSDTDSLNDAEEKQAQTDPFDPDTDHDGYDDDDELLNALPTDPNNPDTVAPILTLAGG